jgi:hypothetical protein
MSLHLGGNWFFIHYW